MAMAKWITLVVVWRAVLLRAEPVFPEAPRNLQFTLYQDNCTRADLTWDPPLDNGAGPIISYQVEIFDPENGTTEILYTTENRLSLTLTCCTYYSCRVTGRTVEGIGETGPYVRFRTTARNIEDIMFSSSVLDAVSIRVSWIIPSYVVDQGLTQVEVVVTPPDRVCYTEVMLSPQRYLSNNMRTTDSFTIAGLEPDFEYHIEAFVTLCHIRTSMYNNTETTLFGPIVAPVIDSVVRSSPLEADIDFSTELSANLFELYLYESTGDANQDRDTSVSPLRVITVSDPVPAAFDMLSTCGAYWVSVTAITCARAIKSTVSFIDVLMPRRFSAEFSLPIGTACSTWIDDRLAVKIESMQEAYFSAISLTCGVLVNCVKESAFTCLADQHLVAFDTILASSYAVSSDRQYSCLTSWAATGPAVRLVGGNVYVVTSPTARPTTATATSNSNYYHYNKTTPPPDVAIGTSTSQESSSGLSGIIVIVGAVVGVVFFMAVVAGFFITIILVLAVLLTRRRRTTRRPNDNMNQVLLSTHTTAVDDQEEPVKTSFKEKENFT